MLTMVLVLVKSTWTMLTAVAVRVNLLIAQEASLSPVIVAIQMMLECDVKVDEPHLERRTYNSLYYQKMSLCM